MRIHQAYPVLVPPNRPWTGCCKPEQVFREPLSASLLRRMHSVPLPPPQIRQGDRQRRFDDDFFVETAERDARLLMSVGLEPGQRLLDFGCGPGRLAIGLIARGWEGSYLGVEVKARHVEWADRQITSRFPDFRFARVDAANPRYNPTGAESPRLPAGDATFDMVCAFSVFSHMLSDDTAAHLAEIRRVLTDNGRAFVTAFVADDVPDETENPPWLGDWSGRLHCVLYSTSFLTRLIHEAGFAVDRIEASANDRQAGLMLTPGDSGRDSI